LADSGPNFETEPSQRKLTRVARLVLLGVRIATASLQMRAIIPWFGGGGGGIPDRGNHGRFHRLPGGAEGIRTSDLRSAVTRRMSLIASSAGCFPGPDFCLIFAPCGYDDPEILPT